MYSIDFLASLISLLLVLFYEYQANDILDSVRIGHGKARGRGCGAQVKPVAGRVLSGWRAWQPRVGGREISERSYGYGYGGERRGRIDRQREHRVQRLRQKRTRTGTGSGSGSSGWTRIKRRSKRAAARRRRHGGEEGGG